MIEPLLDRCLTVDQVAEDLGLRRDTLHDWARSGRIPHLRIGRRLLFRPEHVDQFRHLRPHRPAWTADADVPVCPGVYFVVGAGLVKIGIVGPLGIRVRMTNLQNGSPIPLTLYRFVPHQRPAIIEADLHSRYSIHHSHGEWFMAPPVLADIVEWPDALFPTRRQWPALGGQSGGQSGQEIAQPRHHGSAQIPQKQGDTA